MDFRKINNISVDCVIFGFDTNGIQILLKNRRLQMFSEKHPSIDDWVLTGHHIFKSETLDVSADRIFNEATGLENIYKKQFRTFGNPKRIKNERDLLWVKSSGFSNRTMSVAYYFLLPTAKVILKDEEAKWFPVKSLPEMGFDHNRIVKAALQHLKEKVMIEPIIFQLLPDKFTLNELQLAYESVLDIKIDNRNFRKKAIGKPYIVLLDEKRVGTSKKPANLYMFSKDIYDRVSSKNYVINV